MSSSNLVEANACNWVVVKIASKWKNSVEKCASVVWCMGMCSVFVAVEAGSGQGTVYARTRRPKTAFLSHNGCVTERGRLDEVAEE
ncbi:hypothetical protein MTP99_019124 [Tenebrio molitor]|jgi:hypothetical protein|nr:hypothetical protein MTP99_019124 [Tenebrio molitor]